MRNERRGISKTSSIETRERRKLYFLRTLFLFICSALLGADFAFAGRSVITPMYSRRIIFSIPYTPAVGATPASPADGTPIMTMQSVMMNISNISNMAQAVRVRLLPGTSGWGGQVGRTASTSHRFVICASPAISGTVSDLPLEGKVTIGAKGVYQIVVWSLGSSTYSYAGPAGLSAVDSTFSPVIEVLIDDDRGAVLGTIIPNWDGPVPASSLCDGTSLNGYTSIDSTEGRTGVPLLINGGRPF